MKVGFRPFVTRTCNDIAVGSSFNSLIKSGILHPTGVLTVPFVCTTPNGILHPTGVLIVPFVCANPNAGFGDVQWKSPFDTSPATKFPLSLDNLKASVGSHNVLQSTLNYNYEHVISEVNPVYLCILHQK